MSKFLVISNIKNELKDKIIPAYQKAIIDKDNTIKNLALNSLSYISNSYPEVIPSFLECFINGLKDNNPTFITNCAQALWNLSLPTSNQKLIRSYGGLFVLLSRLNHPDLLVKENVSGVLTNMTQEEESREWLFERGIVKMMINLLNNKDIEIIRNAIDILVHMTLHERAFAEMKNSNLLEQIKLVKDYVSNSDEELVFSLNNLEVILTKK